MPYVRIDEDIFIDPDDVLPHCTADELIKELQNRGERVPDNIDGKIILGALRNMNCPSEIYNMVESWTNNRLSLSELLSIK